MGQRLSQGERFIASFESLIREAEQPQGPARVQQAAYPFIKPEIAKDQQPMAPSIKKRDRDFEMFSGGKQFTHPVRGVS
jgi:hypothetical protein